MDLTNLNKDRKNRRKPSMDLSTSVYGKIPPQAKEMEEEILGAVLNRETVFDIASEILQPQCFYVDAHQKIFKAFILLRQANTPIDILTAIEQLKKGEELEAIGGPYALTQISGKAKFGGNIEAHCKIILQKFLQREVIRISGEAISEAYEDSTEVNDLLESTLKQLDKLNAGIYTKEASNMMEASMEMQIQYSISKERKEGEISGIPSGFKGIDKITWGFQPTDLIIFAARPSVGKSAISTNFAVHAAKNKIPVGIFSLEMSTQQYVARILSAESGVNLENISRGTTNEIEDRIVKETFARIAELPIYIDDTAGLNIVEFRAKARRLVSKNGVKEIFIDYLQLMSFINDGSKKSTTDQIGVITKELKKIAKELNVPIIALSQLVRDVDKRDKEPMPKLSDLRDSGNIESDADVVMFLYNENGSPKVRIAKHRNGILATIFLRSDLKIQRFFDVEQSAIQFSNEPPPIKKGEEFDVGYNEDEKDEFNFK